MLVQNYISAALPAVSPKQSIQEVLYFMESLSVEHLPVVDNDTVLGIASRLELLGRQATAGETKLYYTPHEGLEVLSMQHIFDAVKVMLDSDVSVVPVLDMQRRYMGCITRADLVRVLGEITSSTEPGDMIILEIERHNYSLTKIASILEQHSAKVINMFLSPVPLSYNIYVNLKITGSDTSAVVLSLERHGYRISYIFADNDLLRDSKDRFDALMRFINL